MATIYRKGDAQRFGKHTVFFCPARDGYAETPDFKDANNEAIEFPVTFINGKALDVPDTLARYLIDTGVAQWSPIIIVDRLSEMLKPFKPPMIHL